MITASVVWRPQDAGEIRRVMKSILAEPGDRFENRLGRLLPAAVNR